jgi:hypothetical protein
MVIPLCFSKEVPAFKLLRTHWKRTCMTKNRGTVCFCYQKERKTSVPFFVGIFMWHL